MEHINGKQVREDGKYIGLRPFSMMIGIYKGYSQINDPQSIIKLLIY